MKISVDISVQNKNELLEAVKKVEENINELKYNLSRIPSLKIDIGEAKEEPSGATDSSDN